MFLNRHDQNSVCLEIVFYIADWLSNNDDQFSNIENEPTDKLEMEACMRWTYDGSSNMAVLEISLLTGLIPDTESLENVIFCILHQIVFLSI